MDCKLTDIQLLRLSKFIENELALHFPKERWCDLERNIILASRQFGYEDLNLFFNHLYAGPLTRELAEGLAAHLTINETYFWREPLTFEALEQKILPELVKERRNKGKHIRIWSAGCSAGEEPYSIAIALKRIIPDINDWHITILATDISPNALQKARSGIYGKWSFRGTPDWLLNNYFKPVGKGLFELVPSIKKMVNFQYLNLAENIYPSTTNSTHQMDIVYCRNVLMYFTQQRFRQIGFALYNSLVYGGYLVVSSSELSVNNFPEFEPVNIPGFVLYRKNHPDSKIKQTNFVADVHPTEVVANGSYHPQKVDDHSVGQSLESDNKPLSTDNTDSKIIAGLFATGHYHKIIELLKNEALTTEQDLLLIRSHANLGHISDALAACEKAILTEKLEPRLYYLHASILQINNQPEEAVSCLKRAIFIDSDFVLAYYSLGNILLSIKDLPGAKKYYRNVLTVLEKCHPDDLVPESEGLTVSRLKNIVETIIHQHKL